ncbi:MAG: DNA alkylation repair protein [Bacteroidetes bacterium]|nr:DNA alkylation repair protein [Bacteroidota bacterium]
MVFTPELYLQEIIQRFQAFGHPDIAQGQIAYMRNQFDFFGIKTPQRNALVREILENRGIPTGETLHKLIQLCYDQDQRELQYFALTLLEKSIKKLEVKDIDLLEGLIVQKSWWDTVDWIAKLTGMYFKRFPMQIKPVTARWMDSGNIWLQRVSIIFQLTYKEKTDFDLLFSYISRIAGSKEFFLQKGAGWALRQYSRTNPDAVRMFVESHALAPLTRREALRLMDRP